MSNDTKIDLAVIQARYEAAKTMPPGITAAKRVHIQKSDHIDNWWVGFGKDEICQIEGTPNHWRWAAMLILGLADRKDAPYTEDKPTPEVVPALLEQLAQAAKREATAKGLLERLRGALEGDHHFQGERYFKEGVCLVCPDEQAHQQPAPATDALLTDAEIQAVPREWEGGYVWNPRDVADAQHAKTAAHYEAKVRELEQSNRDLADVLQDLCDVQNGPPLPKYEAAWSDTMELAERLLEARAHLAKESHDAK